MSKKTTITFTDKQLSDLFWSLQCALDDRLYFRDDCADKEDLPLAKRQVARIERVMHHVGAQPDEGRQLGKVKAVGISELQKRYFPPKDE